MLSRKKIARPSSRKRHAEQFSPRLDTLETREVPAVVAFLNTTTLIVTGEIDPNNIAVSADANGNLQVRNNGAAVTINTIVGTATNVNLKTVNVDAKGGDDTILIDKSINVLDANG